MSNRYHASKKDGSPSICNAPPGKCPIGEDTPHFDGPNALQEATKYYLEQEEKNASQAGYKLPVRKKSSPQNNSNEKVHIPRNPNNGENFRNNPNPKPIKKLPQQRGYYQGTPNDIRQSLGDWNPNTSSRVQSRMIFRTRANNPNGVTTITYATNDPESPYITISRIPPSEKLRYEEMSREYKDPRDFTPEELSWAKIRDRADRDKKARRIESIRKTNEEINKVENMNSVVAFLRYRKSKKKKLQGLHNLNNDSRAIINGIDNNTLWIDNPIKNTDSYKYTVISHTERYPRNNNIISQISTTEEPYDKKNYSRDEEFKNITWAAQLLRSSKKDK